MFYVQFIQLCKEHNENPTNVAEAIGLNKSSATAWKNGSVPKDITLAKLEEHFGLEPGYFKESGNNYSASLVSDGGYSMFKDANNTISILLNDTGSLNAILGDKADRIKIELREVDRVLMNEVSDMSEEEVRKMIEFVRAMKGKNNG